MRLRHQEYCGHAVATPRHATHLPTLPLDEIHFIDFEYARCNPPAYDIGNHFNEHAGVENVDYEQYPEQEFQHGFLRHYLAELNSTLRC